MSGFAVHGNFWNYYQFNEVKARLTHLDIEKVLEHIRNKKSIEKITLLDVGCNEGDVTMAIFDQLSSVLPIDSINFLGIDIDQELINRANAKSTNLPIEFICSDFMNSTASTDYLAKKKSGKQIPLILEKKNFFC